MKQPLTARQLVNILVLIALIVGVVMFVHDHDKSRSHESAVNACLASAPLGWDCQHHPTGY